MTCPKNQQQKDIKFLKMAIELSLQGTQQRKGGPFGCVIVKNEEVVGKGQNLVTSTNDPSAHAEIVAIRDACKNVSNFHLNGCVIYSSCEPCPMCLGAIYWSNIERVVFSNTRKDAAEIQFDDLFIYNQIPKRLSERQINFINIPLPEAKNVFEKWDNDKNKVQY